MKRKIAAIFAADIAGYSRLVAEDEEETLRRLAAYRAVVDDFIVRAGGRIFNTAGDAVLAEFPSAVEAVRCAIDIQESLRTRNMAYPPSRQMSFRIGITIGDVVERDGDLLGDGVNIAARLEGLAEVGGICVSRAVHEQVVNKLSVQFADIGAQEIKNIPTPVHAYMVAMRREDGTHAVPQPKKPTIPATAGRTPGWMWPLAVTVVALAAIGVGGFLYFIRLELQAQTKETASAAVASQMATAPAAADASPAPSPAQAPSAAPMSTAPASPANPSSASSEAVPPQPARSQSTTSAETFTPETVPFIGERARTALANDYMRAADYKAFATTINGVNAFVTGQPSEEAAKAAALEQCERRSEAGNVPRRCELYAVGNMVVYPHERPPLPPLPWVKHDPTIERPFSVAEMPLIRAPGRGRLEVNYVPARKSKAIALGPGGQFFFSAGADVPDDAMRRNLEACGAIAGAACMVVALDDVFVVPVPTMMRATGFFHGDSHPALAPGVREEVGQCLASATSGWNAVAVGAAGRAGLGLKAASERAAVNDALAECASRDSGCHVIAIGPFTVTPN
jgi:adenylate cyclase